MTRPGILAAQRRRYAAKVAASLCVYGGCTAPARPGYRRCEGHASDHAERQGAYEDRRDERGAA